MAWLEVHQELREHRKLYACADDLGVEPVTMLGMLISLWLWALDNVQDGNLAGEKGGQAYVRPDRQQMD